MHPLPQTRATLVSRDAYCAYSGMVPGMLTGQYEAAQAHIDLLAIEPNAWRFSSKTTGFSVVSTRTEIDWASKNAQPCVWAPAKFVMDAVASPLDLINDPVALAHWFAQEIGAEELVLLGEKLPNDSALPCRTVPVEQLTIATA